MLTFSVQRCSSRLLHRSCHRRFLWWRKQHPSARSCITSAGAGSTASISVFRPATATRSYSLRKRSAGVQEVHGRESGKSDHLWMVLGSTQGLPGCGKPVLRAERMRWYWRRRSMKRGIPYEHIRRTFALQSEGAMGDRHADISALILYIYKRALASTVQNHESLPCIRPWHY